MDFEKAKEILALRLCEAVETHSLRDVLYLLDHDRADPNILVPGKGISPFHLVIGCESASFAEEATCIFLQFNGDPNILSEDGLTPVHVAAVWGRTKLLVYLLSCGGDPWVRDFENGLTPLHLALKEKQWEAAFILYRFQSMDRRKQCSDIKIAPRFNINFERVVVIAGEMQAEYVMSPQDNLSPVLMSPVQESKKSCNWNIKPLETQEYVRQWCHKEFMPIPITSTPTLQKPRDHFNLVSKQGVQKQPVCDSDVTERNPNPNITSSKLMTPKTLNVSNLAKTNENLRSKNVPQNSNDVRKTLFSELKKLKKGFPSFSRKQSFNSSIGEQIKGNSLERLTSSKNFSIKRAAVVDKLKFDNNPAESHSKETENVIVDCDNKNTCPETCRMTELSLQDLISSAEVNMKVIPSLENSPVDEVDALPLVDTEDTSLEWIASQSCFSDQNSPNSTNSQIYFTCDEGSTTDMSNALLKAKDVPVIVDKALPVINAIDLKAPQRPPRRKQLKSISHPVSETGQSSARSCTSFGTIISEEYRYTDEEAGVVLIENHLLTKPLDVPNPSDSESIVSVPHTVNSDAPSTTSDVSSVPASFCYDAVALRRELLALGETVGPITSTTEKVYLRRLYRLKHNKSVPHPTSEVCVYSSELQRILRSKDWEMEIMSFSKLESLMSAPFENPDPHRRWREGVTKSSFNYLLLDPRLSCNLPASTTSLDMRTWNQFLSAIFYVGKGKRSRPYSHLYQAVQFWNKGQKSNCSNAKVKRIIDIWKEGHGVVCLHVFQNIIPVEAYTREAAMLDAIGTDNLVNMKKGEYYGPASTWQSRFKRELGIYLLYRAMKVFLSEGERQLRPHDID